MTRYVDGAGVAVARDASKALGVAVNVDSGKVCGATSTGVELVVANSAGEGVGVASLVNFDCACDGVAVSSQGEGEGDFNESDA